MADEWAEFRTKPTAADPWADFRAPAAPQGVAANAIDLVKSAPRALLSGISNTLSATGQAEQLQMNQPVDVPSKEEMTGALEKNITGELHKPQTPAGRIGTAAIEGLASPLSFIGPGGTALKIGSTLAGGAGGEIGRQLAEGTPYETAAGVAGSLAGGVTAAKRLGPTAERAAVPTIPELRGVKDAGYKAAREADLVLHPAGPASKMAEIERELTNGPKYAFTGGTEGTAPKTLSALANAQKIPAAKEGERYAATGADLDKLRIQLNNIAGETHEFKPTPDAKAAMVAKQRLAEYTENIPQNHVLGGDASAYGAETRRANANNAAFRRAEGFQQKLTNATDATEGGIATKIDNQIKSKLRQGYLTNPKQQRGLTQEEVGAIRDTNRGTRTERMLRQIGRFAPESPVALALHMSAGAGPAMLTGGASIPIQIAGALAASAAKHGAQRMTKANAAKVAEMLAKRSPEYQRRLAMVPQVSKAPHIAAIARALATGVAIMPDLTGIAIRWNTLLSGVRSQEGEHTPWSFQVLPTGFREPHSFWPGPSPSQLLLA